MGTLLLLGFLLGMRHALEADHVAAVATLTTSTNTLGSAIKQGAVWGMGHTITLFLFGSAVLLSNSIIPEDMAQALEFAVGVMLIVLGADVLRKMVKDKVHFHVHQHGDLRHFHAHKHAPGTSHNSDSHEHRHGRFPRKALFIGLMHGMAGSAALILLTLQNVTSTATGLLYMLLFGVGSILGMAALSAIIFIPLQHSAKTLTWLNNSLQLIVGLLTTSLGAFVTYSIGSAYI